jgi:hypothetical protein
VLTRALFCHKVIFFSFRVVYSLILFSLP